MFAVESQLHTESFDTLIIVVPIMSIEKKVHEYETFLSNSQLRKSPKTV